MLRSRDTCVTPVRVVQLMCAHCDKIQLWNTATSVTHVSRQRHTQAQHFSSFHSTAHLFFQFPHFAPGLGAPVPSTFLMENLVPHLWWRPPFPIFFPH